MKYKGKRTLEVLEGANNYNNWIASRIKRHIKNPALEIGAGMGNISEKLLTKKELTLTDVDMNLVNFLHNKFGDKNNVTVESLDISKNFSRIKYKFRTVYSINVLEHIKDDVFALKNMYRLLGKGGKIVILVPANKKVYCRIDKKLGHYRRYEKSELKKLLDTAGFKSVQIEYFNMVGLLSWYIRDKIDGRSSNLKPSHVKFFDLIVPMLMKIEPKKGLPFGISLIATGIKK